MLLILLNQTERDFKTLLLCVPLKISSKISILYFRTFDTLVLDICELLWIRCFNVDLLDT